MGGNTKTQITVKKMIDFLSQPFSYPHSPGDIAIIQTHASILAIAPPFVYKVKKHINLGFLDFTTLEKRRNNCEREIRLNSRLCPYIYLDIVPISLKNDDLIFDDKGLVVDYAVKMKQLPGGYFLNQLLREGKVTKNNFHPIVQCLKHFYKSQLPDETISAYGAIDKIRINTDGNFKYMKEFIGHSIRKSALDAIKFFTDDFYKRNSLLFEKRIKEYRIKDGHGDLRLEHIHLQGDKVCIYDCIEFNDRFRYIDMASDIAFLTMDIDFHHMPGLSVDVTKQMISALDDKDMALLMDFYKCYRACVRGKVESIKSLEPEIDSEEREESRLKAERFFKLALQYAVCGSVPAVFVVSGRIGSGKSTIAENMAELLGWQYCSSDITRKKEAGLSLQKRTPEEKRRGLYGKETTDGVYHYLLKTAVEKVQRGEGVVLDATFGSKDRREKFINAFEQNNISYYFIEAWASDEIIKQRLFERDNKHVISDARIEDFELLSSNYNQPTEISIRHLLKVNTELDIEDNLSNIFIKLIQLKEDN